MPEPLDGDEVQAVGSNNATNGGDRKVAGDFYPDQGVKEESTEPWIVVNIPNSG